MTRVKCVVEEGVAFKDLELKFAEVEQLKKRTAQLEGDKQTLEKSFEYETRTYRTTVTKVISRWRTPVVQEMFERWLEYLDDTKV
jgi:cell shape-determining protein MreC